MRLILMKIKLPHTNKNTPMIKFNNICGIIKGVLGGYSFFLPFFN